MHNIVNRLRNGLARPVPLAGIHLNQVDLAFVVDTTG